MDINTDESIKTQKDTRGSHRSGRIGERREVRRRGTEGRASESEKLYSLKGTEKERRRKQKRELKFVKSKWWVLKGLIRYS